MGIISSDKLQDYAGCFSTEDDLTYVEIWNFQVDKLFHILIRITDLQSRMIVNVFGRRGRLLLMSLAA